MAAGEQIVELVSTKEIELFLPVMQEIDFGDAFLLSMLHRCGIGKRSRPLDYGQVFLLRAKSQIIGASGLLSTTGNALTCLLARMVCNPPSIPPRELWHSSHSTALRCGSNRRFNRALGLHRFPR
jgi:hypothetical protein